MNKVVALQLLNTFKSRGFKFEEQNHQSIVGNTMYTVKCGLAGSEKLRFRLIFSFTIPLSFTTLKGPLVYNIQSQGLEKKTLHCSWPFEQGAFKFACLGQLHVCFSLLFWWFSQQITCLGPNTSCKLLAQQEILVVLDDPTASIQVCIYSNLSNSQWANIMLLFFSPIYIYKENALRVRCLYVTMPTKSFSMKPNYTYFSLLDDGKNRCFPWTSAGNKFCKGFD